MSGRRRTDRERVLWDIDVACAECYPYPGSGGTNAWEHGLESRHGSLKLKNGESLPRAGNGFEPSTGPCPECVGQGLASIPWAEWELNPSTGSKNVW